MGEGNSFSRFSVDGTYGPIQCLEGGSGFLLGYFHGTDDDHGGPLRIVEAKFDVGFDTALADGAGIMNEA